MLSSIMREYMEKHNPKLIFTGDFVRFAEKSERMCNLIQSNKHLLLKPEMDMELAITFARYSYGGRYCQIKEIGCLDDSNFPPSVAGPAMIEDFLDAHQMSFETAPEDIKTLWYIMMYKGCYDRQDLSAIVPNYAFPYVELIGKVSTLNTATDWYTYVDKNFANNEKKLIYRYGINPSIWDALEQGTSFAYENYVTSYEDHLLFLLGSTLRILGGSDENMRKLVKRTLLGPDILTMQEDPVAICMVKMINRYLSGVHAERAISLLLWKLSNA